MKILSFKSKDDQVSNHWFAIAPDFSLSSAEFYAAMETELTSRKIPGLNISRVVHTSRN